MITAYLPSGYLLYSGFKQPDKPLLFACLLGATWPDLGLIWFYLIDDRAFHHHRYWVHAPAFWAMITLLALPVAFRLRQTYKRATIGFLLAWFLHLCLDSIVGSIMWLWLFSNRFFQLAIVEPTHTFIMRWSFALEIAIWLAALSLLLIRRVR